MLDTTGSCMYLLNNQFFIRIRPYDEFGDLLIRRAQLTWQDLKEIPEYYARIKQC